jgi:hypothetical protein
MDGELAGLSLYIPANKHHHARHGLMIPMTLSKPVLPSAIAMIMR